MNILIVEDEKITRELIKNLLIKDYTVFEANNSVSCFDILGKNEIDLVILDIMLPGANGFFICEEIRKKEELYGTPLVLMLTSKTQTEDLVQALNLGADDYLKKPFDNRELQSRIIALMRRKIGFSKTYKYETIEVDTEKLIIKDLGKEIDFSRKEYELLLFFIINKGIVLSREKLLEKIWKIEFYEGNRTVDTYVKQLRKKIPLLEEKLLSIRGFGYKLM